MDLQKIQEEAIKTARLAGDYIRRERKDFDWSKVEQKENFSDLVSYVDKEAEKIIVESLTGVLPEAGFIGEEGVGDEKKGTYNWIIDPLDGTTNFLHDLPVYCVSIALVKEKEELAGVVYEVNRDECFHAVKGDGAFCNGRKITVSPAVSLSESLLATGFPYVAFEKMPQYLRLFDHFMRTTHGVRRLGSAAADLAYVAAGRLEGFFEFGLNAWDMAAGTLLVKEAGGFASDFEGGNNYLFGNNGLVAGSKLHPEILKTVQEFWNR